MKRLAVLIAVALVGFLLYLSQRHTRPEKTNVNPLQSQATLKSSKSKLPAREVQPPSQSEEFGADAAGALQLEGQVVDEAGAPVSGARLALSSNPTRYTTSDAGGLFVFEGLLARSYYVEGRKEGLSGSAEALLNEDEIPVIIKLRQGVAVQVTVLDALDQHPLEGAEVSSGWRLKSEATTDREGKATIFSTGVWTLVAVRADGYAPRQESFRVPSGSSNVFEKEFLLSPGASVSGLVLDSNERPVAGASIGFESSADRFGGFGWFSDAERSIVSDAQGRWTIPALSTGTFRFFAMHKKFAAGSSSPVTLDGKTPTTDVIIHLEEGATLSGQVVDAQGSPVFGALVVAQRDSESAERSKRAFTDEQGGFTLEGLVKDKTIASATKDGARSELFSADLSSGPVTDARLQLSIVGEISGVVVLADGSPVEGAQIDAFGQDQGFKQRQLMQMIQSVLSDAEGRFTLKGVPAGERFELSVYKENLDAPASWRDKTLATFAQAGDRNVRVVMKTRGAVSGKVLYKDNTPPAKGKIYSLYRDEVLELAPDGAFLLKNVPSGDSPLFVEGSFVSKRFGPFPVVSGETFDAGVLYVDRGRRITGRVTLADGAPVSGAEVYLQSHYAGNGSKLSDSYGDAPTARSGADGTFTAEGLEEDAELYAIAEHPSKGRSQIIKVGKGTAALSLTLMLESTGALEGNITYQGKPAALEVEVTPETMTYGGSLSVRSNEEGFYRFDALTPGRYLFTASRGAQGGIKTILVTVEPSKTTRADLDIPAGVALSLMATRAGAAVKGLSFYLLKGSHSPKDSEQLAASLRPLREDEARVAALLLEGADEKVVISDVVAGSYTLCLVIFFLPGEVPPDEEPPPKPIDCSPVSVSATPKAQSVIRELP